VKSLLRPPSVPVSVGSAGCPAAVARIMNPDSQIADRFAACWNIPYLHDHLL